jgi:type III secretory pathway component EscT
MVVPHVELWLLAFARAVPVVALHPVFGGGATPRAVKVAVAAALATAAAGAGPRDVAPLGMPALATAALVELVAGAAIGFVGQIVFGVVEAAGRLADDARGANVARLFAPQLEAASSPLGQLELNASIAIFWGAGLHLGLVTATLAPTPPAPVRLEAIVSAAAALSRAGLAIAGPAAFACVLADALMGLVNRAAPQANVFSLALPVKLAAAVLVTAVGYSERVDQWMRLWSAHDVWIGAAPGPSG